MCFYVASGTYLNGAGHKHSSRMCCFVASGTYLNGAAFGNTTLVLEYGCRRLTRHQRSQCGSHLD